MIGKISGIVFTVVLALVCLALAEGYGPPRYYDAEARPPVPMQTDTADAASTPQANDAAITRDKQPSPLLQAQD